MAIEGPSDFIHPIIQAMIASQERLQRGAQLQEETRRNKAEEAYRNQALEQAHNEFTSRLAEEAKVHEAQIELEKARGETERQQRALQFFDALHSGAAVPQAVSLIGGQYNAPQSVIPQQSGMSNGEGFTIPEVSTPESITLPGIGGQPGATIPTSALPSPEKATSQQIQLAGGMAGAKAAAEFPFQQELEKTKFGNELNLEQAKLDSAQKINSLDTASRERIAELARKTELMKTNSEIGARLAIAGMEYGVTPEQSRSLGLLVGTGQMPINLANPIERRIASQLGEQGWKVGPELAKNVDAYKAVQSIEPILDKFDDFTNNYLSSKPGGNVVTGIKGSLPFNDTKAAYDSLYSNLQLVAKNLEGFGQARPLTQQLSAETKSIPTPSDSVAQAKKKIAALRQRVEEAKANALQGMPAEQVAAIKQVNPGISNKPQYRNIHQGPNGDQIGIGDDNKWHDIKTGQVIQ